MNFLQNETVRGILRVTIAVAGFVAAVWHAMHAATAWTQSQEYRASEPPLADYFQQAVGAEIGVSVVAMLAGVVAWRLFKPKPVQPGPSA